jgi:hypothetical protein
MKVIFIFLFFGCLLLACGSNSDADTDLVEVVDTLVESPLIDSAICFDTSTEPLYTVEPFEKTVNDWGYRIMIGDAMFINQPHIPAAQGNAGFSSEEKARKAGEFMINKLDAGISPPTVSIEELDSLGVLG